MVRYLGIALFVSFLYAHTLVIAANAKFPLQHLSLDTIRDLYLDRRHTLGGYRVILLNLPFDSRLRKVFEREVLKKSRSELERYWLIAHYKGHRPPKVVQSQEAVARYIQKIPYAIGYMDKQIALQHNLKILYQKSY